MQHSRLTAEGTSRHVEVDGLTVHLHDTGPVDGADSQIPLVLLHGGGPGASGWSNFSRNVDAVAQHFRVLVVDQVGFGGTDTRIPDNGVWRQQSAVLAGLFDELGIPKVHFIGNSLGGGAAMRFTLDHPERVGRLVLIGPAGGLANISPGPSEGTKTLASFYSGSGPSRDKMKRVVSTMVFDRGWVTDELVDQRFEAATRPGAMEFGNWMYRAGERPGIRLEDIWRDVDGIKNPVLLVWGRDDRVVGLDSALFLLRRLRDAQLHVFSRCGHWAQFERRDEFNGLVIDFLTAYGSPED